MLYRTIVSWSLVIISMSVFAEDATSYKTRYGQFQIKASDTYPSGALYFDQKLVQPLIEGNNSLSVKGVYKLNKDDVLLVQDHGGSGCPTTLYFVKLSPIKNVSVSPAFGSCSDLLTVLKTKDQIIVKMPDFMGDAESGEQERKIAKHKITYIYDGKVITENGRLVKNRERW